MITDAQEKFLTIDLMRLGSMKGTISVNYYTEDGSAKAGLHYESIAGEVPRCAMGGSFQTFQTSPRQKHGFVRFFGKNLLVVLCKGGWNEAILALFTLKNLSCE